MQLVLEEAIHPKVEDRGLGILSWRSYLPLIVIIALIGGTTGAIAMAEYLRGTFSVSATIGHFMAGFFIVFAGFKIMDLKGFAEGYFTYDLLASRWIGYGYLYPFIELGFGLAMVMGVMNAPLLWAEFAVMAFSGIGVVIKLAKGEDFQCACLGTFLKVPLTKITVVEDFGMAFLALTLLFLSHIVP